MVKEINLLRLRACNRTRIIWWINCFIIFTCIYFCYPCNSSTNIFCLNNIYPYSLSIVDKQKLNDHYTKNISNLKNPTYFVALSIYIQLIIGAIMRHTESGLAIPDFPLGGYIIPLFNQPMIESIQSMHFDAGLQFVELYQIIIHFFIVLDINCHLFNWLFILEIDSTKIRIF